MPVVVARGLSGMRAVSGRSRSGSNSGGSGTSGGGVASPPANAVNYGPRVVGDELNNVLVGSTGALKHSYRFRAAYSGALTDINIYVIGAASGSGYGGGTGGTWRVQLFADDGTAAHLPTGGALATQNMAAFTASTANKSVTFSSPYTVTAGTLYHLVFENTDPSPNTNYWSLDLWYCYVQTVQPGYGTLTNDARPQPVDWGWLRYTGGTWNSNDGDRTMLPIMNLHIGSNNQGESYGEASYSAGQQGELNSTTKMVRERFTLSGGDRVVSGAAVRLYKIAGGTGALTVSLENSSGTLIDSFTVAAASIADGTAPSAGGNAILSGAGQARWVSGSFSAPRTLTNGQEYRLRLSVTGNTTAWAWVQRRLYPSFNYASTTAYTDGFAEKTTDGSTWSSLGRVTGQNDLSFYLVTQ